MASNIEKILNFDTNTKAVLGRLSVGSNNRATVHFWLNSGAIGSLAISVKRSNGGPAVALPTPVSITAEGFTDAFDVTGVGELEFEITTAAGGAGRGSIALGLGNGV